MLFSRSSRADVGVYAINRLITLMISPLLITQLSIATGLYTALHGQALLRPAAFAAAPEALYTEGRGAFEFERTASRLEEMQGEDWPPDESA